MALAPGTRLGVYEVASPLGSGGMGEVYRATDTRLKRDVAIKVLLPEVAQNPERLARFEREAQILASLNHPNVAAIYGVEQAGDTTALILEFIDGPTLADRIARGPIPVEEALPIAKQIVEALEAAHEQGVIHRDLKPANIKVRADGTVKVLDFGLAKALAPLATAAVGAAKSDSPTLTSPALMTGVGVLLGTAAYMSPEQARGKPADRRSDIWAFGCIFYEMLTGSRAFAGESVTDVIAGVVTRDPDWSRLPPPTASAVTEVLKRSLRKDPSTRVQAIGDVRIALDEAGAAHGPASGTRPPGRRFAAIAIAALVGAALALAVALVLTRSNQPSSGAARESRLQIASTGANAVALSGLDNDVAITADGSRVVYVGDHGTQLFVRALDSLDVKSIASGEVRGPFVSPDGRWVGYLESALTIRRVPIDGGPSSRILNVIGGLRGASWTTAGTLVFAGLDAPGLQEVPVEGGTPTILTTPDRSRGEQNHWWPDALPDGRSVLFTIVPTTGGIDAAQIALLDRQTKQWKVLLRGGSHPHYDPRGYLVYGGAGSIRAVPFDLATGSIGDQPTTVASQVDATSLGAFNYAMAADGTLVYVPSGSGFTRRALSWVDRHGNKTRLPVPVKTYIYPRVSPDGSRVIVSSQDEEYDLWSWDIRTANLTRLTFEPGQDSFPAWTPDGKRVVFVSTRTGKQTLFWQPADGSGSAEQLTEALTGNVSAVTPDGGWALLTRNSAATGYDIMKVQLGGERRVETVLQTPFNERNAEVSPNGRWLAYQSDEAGRYEVFVRPFPNVDTGGRWQISYGGGTRPLWGPDGRELFYLSATGLMRVPVESASRWSAGMSEQLFSLRVPWVSFAGRSYDITPDGTRFIVPDTTSDDGNGTSAAGLVVLQHWRHGDAIDRR